MEKLKKYKYVIVTAAAAAVIAAAMVLCGIFGRDTGVSSESAVQSSADTVSAYTLTAETTVTAPPPVEQSTTSADTSAPAETAAQTTVTSYDTTPTDTEAELTFSQTVVSKPQTTSDEPQTVTIRPETTAQAQTVNTKPQSSSIKPQTTPPAQTANTKPQSSSIKPQTTSPAQPVPTEPQSSYIKPQTTTPKPETTKPQTAATAQQTTLPKTQPVTTIPQTAPPAQTEPQYQHYCELTIDCSSILDNMDKLDKNKVSLVPADGIIYSSSRVGFNDSESVFDILKRVCRENGIALESSYTPAFGSSYIEGINNIYEFDCGSGSGWLYLVNGNSPGAGCSSYIPDDGDRVEFIYTCALGEDINGGT